MALRSLARLWFYPNVVPHTHALSASNSGNGRVTVSHRLAREGGGGLRGDIRQNFRSRELVGASGVNALVRDALKAGNRRSRNLEA